ncbi:hypothetical protein D9M72_590370 [compost metagenome]
MRNAILAVIMVGDWALIMSGTESTDIMVTKLRIRPTSSVGRTCGSTISIRMRRRPAPRLRADSIVLRSIEAIAPASSNVTKGVCFQTNAITMPRQSRKLIAWSGVRTPLSISRLFIRPFLARNVRKIWPTTMKGMNSGQR